jgi:hypothetical protein
MLSKSNRIVPSDEPVNMKNELDEPITPVLVQTQQSRNDTIGVVPSDSNKLDEEVGLVYKGQYNTSISGGLGATATVHVSTKEVGDPTGSNEIGEDIGPVQESPLPLDDNSVGSTNHDAQIFPSIATDAEIVTAFEELLQCELDETIKWKVRDGMSSEKRSVLVELIQRKFNCDILPWLKGMHYSFHDGSTPVPMKMKYGLQDLENQIIFLTKRYVNEVDFDANGPYGVSLTFLLHFLETHDIPNDMTTGEVVETIIKPETVDSKQTYLKAKLWNQHPEYYCKLTAEDVAKRHYTDFGSQFIYAAFLSHAWLMPFRQLVDIATVGPGTKLSPGYNTVLSPDKMSCYFWIDVFCKNQHVPAPAMEEFHAAIASPGTVLIAMWPSKPIALSRIWCLFEMYTAIAIQAHTHHVFTDDCFNQVCIGKRATEYGPMDRAWDTEALAVNVLDSVATVPADRDMILGLIENSVGIEEFVSKISSSIYVYLNERFDIAYTDQMPSCFDGEGLVTMFDGSVKAVKDAVVGNAVLTVEKTRETIILITRDVIKEGRLDMCYIQGVWLTVDHPVFYKGKWVKAQDAAPVESKQIDIVYNFELSNGGSSFLINSLPVIALGNTLGLFPETDPLYGFGWKDNPERQRYVRGD